MDIIDIIVMVAVIAIIAVVYYLVRDTQKKGIPMCGRLCGGSPYHRNSDGSTKKDLP